MILELFVVFIILFLIFLPIIGSVLQGVIIAAVILCTAIYECFVKIYKYFKNRYYEHKNRI
jgi:hypothetical protein